MYASKLKYEENIVTLNVGQDFKKRWLNAPEIVRQTLLEDLTRIGELLKVETDLTHWLDHDLRSQQISQLKIEQAHIALKEQLIEAARQRKQHALEQSLISKRTAQQDYIQQLQQDEIEQFQQQQLTLQTIKEKIDADIMLYSSRFDQIQTPELDQGKSNERIATRHSEQEIANVRLRLELESEQIIQQALSALKMNLQQAAQEEINFILKQLR